MKQFKLLVMGLVFGLSFSSASFAQNSSSTSQTTEIEMSTSLQQNVRPYRECYGQPGGCNAYGCWRDGGGCNAYGCWNGPIGSCNAYGCSDYGTCNAYGCP